MLGDVTSWFTNGDAISWLIVGALAGWLIGVVMRRRSSRVDYLINLGIGLVGEILGRTLFWLLKVNIGLLQNITVNLQDIVAACVGALVLMAILLFARTRVSWLRGI